MSKEAMKLAMEAFSVIAIADNLDWIRHQAEHQAAALREALAEQPAQRKPLTLGQKQRLWSSVGDKPTLKDRVNAYGLAIEAAHGIKGDA